MPLNFHLTEPFPNVPCYAHTGRGGAGNVTRSRPTPTLNFTYPPSKGPTYSSDSEPLNPSAPYPPPRGMSLASNTPTSSRRTFTSGRGGIGNLHPMSERAMFSFDEELEMLRGAEESIAPVYHIGRGGQGNLVRRKTSMSPWDSDSAMSSSASSGGSESGLSAWRSKFERVRNGLSRK